MFSPSLGIDVFGALLPLAVAFACGVLLVAYKFAAKKLALPFLASGILAFLLCHPTEDGVAAAPLLFTLAASVIIAAVNVYPKPSVAFRQNFFVSLLLTMYCVPLALFLVDLAYVPQFAGSVIGGVGLSDGILIAALYAPLSVTAAFSTLKYVSQMLSLLNKNRGVSTLATPEGIHPNFSEEKNSKSPSLQ
jgi:hypothetical protein